MALILEIPEYVAGLRSSEWYWSKDGALVVSLLHGSNWEVEAILIVTPMFKIYDSCDCVHSKRLVSIGV